MLFDLCWSSLPFLFSGPKYWSRYKGWTPQTYKILKIPEFSELTRVLAGVEPISWTQYGTVGTASRSDPSTTYMQNHDDSPQVSSYTPLFHILLPSLSGYSIIYGYNEQLPALLMYNICTPYHVMRNEHIPTQTVKSLNIFGEIRLYSQVIYSVEYLVNSGFILKLFIPLNIWWIPSLFSSYFYNPYHEYSQGWMGQPLQCWGFFRLKHKEARFLKII